MKLLAKIPRKYLRKIFEILIIALALFVLLPQAIGLFQEKDVLSSISIKFILIATAIHSLTPIFAAASYIYLTSKPISFMKSIAVQYASGFTNRLLPSGAGALATVTSFLNKSGLSIPEGLSIAAVNNILGFLAFTITMAFLQAYNLENIKSLLPEISSSLMIIILVFIAVIVIFSASKNKIRKKITKASKEFVSAIKQIISHPASTAMAILANCGITVLHIVCLTLCITSVGYTLPLQIIALVFTAGIAAITVSPTPSGLGLAELALSSALQTFGLPPEQSLVAAVSYRLVTYWIPILPGYFFYRLSRSKNII